MNVQTIRRTDRVETRDNRRAHAIELFSYLAVFGILFESDLPLPLPLSDNKLRLLPPPSRNVNIHGNRTVKLAGLGLQYDPSTRPCIRFKAQQLSPLHSQHLWLPRRPPFRIKLVKIILNITVRVSTCSDDIISVTATLNGIKTQYVCCFPYRTSRYQCSMLLLLFHLIYTRSLNDFTRVHCVWRSHCSNRRDLTYGMYVITKISSTIPWP